MEALQGERAGSVTQLALEEQVRRADPDLHRATLSAAGGSGRILLPIYAFSCEVARSAWISPTPQVCAVRLGWWADVIEGIRRGKIEQGNAVAVSLAARISAANLAFEPFENIVDAHFRYVNKEPFENLRQFESHMDSTACEVMCLAAASLGARGGELAVVREFAWGAGAAAFLREIPRFVRLGWEPMDPEGGMTAEIIKLAVERTKSARTRRRTVSKSVAPVMLPGWRVDATLGRAASDIGRVWRGELEESEFRKRGTLLWRALTGTW